MSRSTQPGCAVRGVGWGRRLHFIACVLIALPSAAWCQSASSPGEPTTAPAVTQPESAGSATPAKADASPASGYTIGSFTLSPSLQAGGFFDDNIYATAHHHVSDWVGSISPRFALQSDWDRHSLFAAAQADLTSYLSHPHENSIDWHALAEGQLDVSTDTHILLGGVVANEHEDRSSPDAVAGIEPTPYYERNAYVGVVHRFDDFTLRVAAAMEHLTFDNVMGQDGEIDNQDRNRVRYTFGGTLRYERNARFKPFVEIMGDMRRYDIIPDNNGFVRNSDGFVAGLGSVIRLSSSISGETFMGVVHRSYRDPAFRPLSVPDFEATLRWRPRPGSAVVLATERSIEETTMYDSPGYVYTLALARLEQKLTGQLGGILRMFYVHRDFAQAGTVDNDLGASAGLRYHLTPRVTLGIDYRYTQRVSGSALTDFTRQQVFFRVGTRF